MKKLMLLLLFLMILSLVSYGQTVHYTTGAVCVSLSTSCPNIPLDNADYLWVHPESTNEWVMPSQHAGMVCSIKLNTVPPDMTPQDANGVVYSSAYKCPDNSIVMTMLKGFRFYYKGGGGRGGGGAGWRTQITSGYVAK